MPFDGSSWDETNPQQSTLANTIDSYDRDLKIGLRVRLAREHVWPSSQTGSSEAGCHTVVTFQNQTSTPLMPVVASVTQGAMLFVATGALICQNSAGSLTTVVNSAGGVNVSGGRYSSTGTMGEMLVGTSGGQLVLLTPGTSGQVLTATTGGTGIAWNTNNALFSSIYNYGTGTTTGTAVSQSSLMMAYGYVNAIGGNSTVTISGLPFSSVGSYTVVTAQANAGAFNEVTSITKVDGGSFSVKNNHSDNVGGNGNVYWMAIGF